ncbi:MAG: flagellar hook-associated protein FlgK [Verrucomicrobia bacterium]|nr:flagellar hook-associated protein FlgK [Verrucomicrobiota bacterium]
MLGLFGTLSLGQRSLQTQQQGIEVAGHNLANVNNPAYSRQRVVIETGSTVSTAIGPQGNGADVSGIEQMRNVLMDQQIQSELSVMGFQEKKQAALQYAESNLGQQIDRNYAGANSANAAQGVGAQQTIDEGLSDLFASFQSVATSPTSLAERQVLTQKAQGLANEFNQVNQRLTQLRTYLDDTLRSDVGAANQLIGQIANLNDKIITTESGATGQANDLRDERQAKIEALSKLVPMQTTPTAAGDVDITIGGVAMVTGGKVLDQLEAYDAGGGSFMVRSQTSQSALSLSGNGGLAGTIDARDGTVANMQKDLNTLATTIISQVNAIHQGGFSLTGSTGANFFVGTDAGSIQVNNALVVDPSLIQASGTTGVVGDNTVALKLAQLADASQAALNNQTFSQSYQKTVAAMGEDLARANSDVGSQQAVQSLLLRQRDSLSGVSLDDEMTDLMKYQKAFAASAKLITTIDQMLDTVLMMKQ